MIYYSIILLCLPAQKQSFGQGTRHSSHVGSRHTYLLCMDRMEISYLLGATSMSELGSLENDL